MTLDASAITVGPVHSAVVVENLTRTQIVQYAALPVITIRCTLTRSSPHRLPVPECLRARNADDGHDGQDAQPITWATAD